MTSEDRDLLESLRRQQAELQQTLAGLNAQLGALEARAGIPEPRTDSLQLPPLPLDAILPPIPADASSDCAQALPPVEFPPLPPEPPLAGAETAALPPVPPEPRSLESHVGSWFLRIGSVFGLIALALVLAWPRVQQVLGHAGLLAVSAVVCLGVMIIGERMEGRGGVARFFGRCFAIAALAWLYLTAFAACYDPPLQVIESPLLAGLLLLLWSIYALLLAERRKSHLLGIFAITLAYVSTALNPIGAFTMGVDLILAATAAVFLLREGWTTLAAIAQIGTYFAAFHRLLVDENGDVVLDTSRTLSFFPYAVFLVITWTIFTLATIVTSHVAFRGEKRFLFLSLNNTCVAGLLALSVYIAGYGPGEIGWTLMMTGLVFLATSRFASVARLDPVDIMGAYAAQGLALITGGIIVVCTGVTRALALLIETFLLGVAGAFAGDRILMVSTYVSGAFATLFLGWEIAVNEHHPWLFGFGGALVMLMNAWNCRCEIRNSPLARTTVVASTACYCVMAIALVLATLYVKLNDATAPPALALAALILTWSIYYFSIYELPGAAQILLLAAQVLVLFPVETGEDLPWWSTFWVAAITVYLVTWWTRQGVIRVNGTIIAVTFLYALALAGLAHQAVRPGLDAQQWMVAASLLSVVFLVYGAFARVWAIAVVGQIFLALALYHFFLPPQSEVFPWNWAVAALPIMVVFASARAAQEWLRLYSDFPEGYRAPVRRLAQGYQLLALAALVRWVFGLIAPGDLVSAFLFAGTLILSMSVRRESTFGIRCSFVPTAIGMWLFFAHLSQAHAMVTFLNGLAMFLFLSQTALLRHEGRSLVTPLETWALILFAVLTDGVFISACIGTRLSPGFVTMGWALFALFLFVFGLAVRERRLSWCGVALVVLSILRVLCYDMWSLSIGFRALTFFVLAFILLGIGVIILRRARPTIL